MNKDSKVSDNESPVTAPDPGEGRRESKWFVRFRHARVWHIANGRDGDGRPATLCGATSSEAARRRTTFGRPEWDSWGNPDAGPNVDLCGRCSAAPAERLDTADESLRRIVTPLVVAVDCLVGSWAESDADVRRSLWRAMTAAKEALAEVAAVYPLDGEGPTLVDRLPGDRLPRLHAERAAKCWCRNVAGAAHPVPDVRDNQSPTEADRA